MSIVFFEYIGGLFTLKSTITLLSFLALAGIFFVISRKTRFDTKVIAYAALAIAAAFALSFVKLFSLPNGGTITVASMLPIFMLSFIAGPRVGLAAGLIHGLLQYIQDPWFAHPAQFLLDYPLAFSLLGLAGFFKDKPYFGIVAGTLGRFVCHFLSGVVFFAEYAGGQNVFLYSAIYNGSYLVPDVVICLAIAAVPGLLPAVYRLGKYKPQES